MLILNEGVPRSGKSYDAVATHILPALKKGRKIFARLDGINHAYIAQHLKLDESVVRERLEILSSDDVRELLRAKKQDKEWVIDDRFRNALIVIDEVHGFYPSDRTVKISEEVEEFFAVHGHYGIDLLVMTQWYKRLATVVRARIERKCVFQKMLAASLENRYIVHYYTTVVPDKFVRVGRKIFKYDPAVFPAYSSYVGSDIDTAVYEGGKKTVWAVVLPAALIFIVALFFGAKAFAGYLFNNEPVAAESVPDNAVPAAPASLQQQAPRVYQPDEEEPPAQGLPVPGPTPQPAAPAAASVVELESMTPESAYVASLARGEIRPRSLGWVTLSNGHRLGAVEWRSPNADPVERLDTDQLRAMGIAVDFEPFGMRLHLSADKVLIVTPWPVYVVRPSESRLYRLDDESLVRGMPASNASSHATHRADQQVIGIGIEGHGGSQARYGQMRSDPVGSDPGPYGGE